MDTLHEASSVRALPGVGPTRAAALENMGIKTIRDLLWNFPRSYENRAAIRPLKDGIDGVTGAFLLTVGTRPRTAKLKGRLSLTKFKAFDESGTVEVVFFNQPYVEQAFEVGETYRFWGKLTKLKTWTLSSPSFERLGGDKPLRDYIPVYPLTEGISRKMMDGYIDSALTATVNDPLPEALRLAHNLPTRSYALRAIHRPESMDELQLGIRRMVFDELFCLALSIGYRKHSKREASIPPCKPCDIRPLLSLLPYELTDSQKGVVNDIYRDMVASGTASVPTMRRILIGDVGSGKTICAVIAMYIAAQSGYSSAVMVPTEILAVQHYKTIEPLFTKLGIRTLLLTGSTPQKEKTRIKELLAQESDIPYVVIGTHALLNRNVVFANLGLTVTDEQHRFGIAQRNTLQQKVPHSHLLVMSATPIPRTFALSLYGDMDVSRIDTLPTGRQTVDTFVVDESYRARLQGFIRTQVQAGGQVYIVCPAIEDEEQSPDEVTLGDISFRTSSLPPLKHAVEYAEDLQNNVFPDLHVALLHGRMHAAEKDAVMARFASGEIDILVSTTVIEVGVNVPNASLMVVENAERFGLAQLHQLRGRVGRGSRKSYCILISDSHTDTAKARLRVLASTSDGYVIAEHDLMQRGPGDFFGSLCSDEVRQSGGVNLKIARFCDDTPLMTAAFEAANRILQQNPTLDGSELEPLRCEINRIFRHAD